MRNGDYCTGFLTPIDMSKKITPKENGANQPNANKGLPGTNLQYDKVQGNRGKQLNTQNKKN